MELAKKKSKSKRLSERSNIRKSETKVRSKERFVACVRGTGFDLLPQKIYRVIVDKKGDRLGYIRVIDESGEDYLYPASWFVPIHLEKTSERRLAKALRSNVAAVARRVKP